MKLNDLVVANTLIKLSPIIVVCALLFGVFSCASLMKSIPTSAPVEKTEEVKEAEPMVSAACKAKFDELYAIEEAGADESDPLIGSREKYWDLMGDAREVMRQMSDMDCPNNPGRIRF
jgi:hypothetical protein